MVWFRLLTMVLLSMVAWSVFAATTYNGILPLRLNEPVSTIADDLNGYIPGYMRQNSIPGVGVALVRNGEIAWVQGFGVKNTLTAQPVGPDTLFEVASNSKVITAYLALRLVDQGLLSLDRPLNGYLTEPWLPPSEYRDTISLRHVLSHSSGLGHATASRENLFAPHKGYFYSAVGYGYLQAVIEHVTGESLENAAQSMVFAPLNMTSSSFIIKDELLPLAANGHLNAFLPALLFLVIYLILLVMLSLILVVIVRIRTGAWRPSRPIVIGTVSMAVVCTLVSVFILLWAGNLREFAWLFALYGIILVSAFVLGSQISSVVLARLFARRSRQQLAWKLSLNLLILVGLASAMGALENLPLPKWPAVQADAAASMRSTTSDLASFLIELSNPKNLSSEMAEEMVTVQVGLGDDLSWGLGPGIHHGREGDVLWQWGQHVDFQSIMMIYPKLGVGVVVCTNSDLLKPDVALNIAHRALGGSVASIRGAIHLAYNYRPDSASHE